MILMILIIIVYMCLLCQEEDSYLLDKEIQDSEEKAKILEAESTLNGFWSESESIVLKAPSGHKLKDIARYEVTVKESVLPEGNLEELDTERKVNLNFTSTI